MGKRTFWLIGVFLVSIIFLSIWWFFLESKDVFPSLIQFEERIAYSSKAGPRRLSGLEVEDFTFRRGKALYNELVTVITLTDSGKKFALRTIERNSKKDPLLMYEKSASSGWSRIENQAEFFRKLIKAVPGEYLLCPWQKDHAIPPGADDVYLLHIFGNAGCPFKVMAVQNRLPPPEAVFIMLVVLL